MRNRREGDRERKSSHAANLWKSEDNLRYHSLLDTGSLVHYCMYPMLADPIGV